MARESKAVKLNDLRKFSQNFKLHTPVPQDLVPILAKDENKQKEIVDKALRAVQEVTSNPPKPAPAPVDPKAIRTGSVKSEATTQGSPNPPGERQNTQRQRPGQNHFSSIRNERPGQNPNFNQASSRSGPGLLSTRLALNQQQHKAAGAVPYNNIPHPIPPVHDLRIPLPTGPSVSSSAVQTPSSTVSTRFNVRAPDFKPNPAANTFLPGGNPSTGSSPRPDSANKSEPRKPPRASFFGAARPASQPRSIADAFNPIARMLKEVQKENKTREYSSNGGIPQAYRTPPTWDVPESNRERSHIDMFERGAVPQSTPASQSVMGNGPIPHHAQQVPAHLQPGPQVVSQAQTPHHTPRHPPAQPHHGQGGQHQFDGHNMQFSQSASSVHPSPRPMPPYLYQNNTPQGMPVYPQQPPMHSYGMSPNVQHVPLRQQGGPQFVTGPAPVMGGQMMTHQHSNGPFMAMPSNPQMAMYSPGPNPAFTHYTTQMPVPPGSNGFPSPRAVGAQMMTHQGSQQGHQPQPMMYGQHGGQVQPMFAHIPTAPMTPMRGPYAQPHQPHYGSPHQHPAYPQPHRGTPSGSYTQPMMQHVLQPQGPPPLPGPVNHGPEGGEEGK
jgi:hypothetical protein